MLERKNIEQSILGIDHCQIGEILAKMWNFPEEILCVIRHYADPFKADACSLAPVVYAAVHIASDFEQDKTADVSAETLDVSIAQYIRMTEHSALSEKIESYHHFVVEAKSYL